MKNVELVQMINKRIKIAVDHLKNPYYVEMASQIDLSGLTNRELVALRNYCNYVLTYAKSDEACVRILSICYISSNICRKVCDNSFDSLDRLCESLFDIHYYAYPSEDEINDFIAKLKGNKKQYENR